MKRMLSLLLAVVLVLTLIPGVPLRAEAKTGGRLVAHAAHQALIT